MNEQITHMKIGGTLYIITAECSPAATETVEKKLERIICRHISEPALDTESYQFKPDNPLAMYKT